MSGINEIILNDPLPIVLQITDGNTGQFPQAEIYGDGIYIVTVNLTHIANGMYRYSGYTMPNNNELSVTYITYSDSYGGTESTVYMRDVDLYRLNTIESKLSNIHGVGSWETGAGGSDWGSTEREQIRDALGVDGTKTKSVGGVIQKIKDGVDAVIAFVS